MFIYSILFIYLWVGPDGRRCADITAKWKDCPKHWPSYLRSVVPSILCRHTYIFIVTNVKLFDKEYIPLFYLLKNCVRIFLCVVIWQFYRRGVNWSLWGVIYDDKWHSFKSVPETTVAVQSFSQKLDKKLCSKTYYNSNWDMYVKPHLTLTC